MQSDFLADAIEQLQRKLAVRWPATQYQKDPVGFARDILGVRLWKKQIEIVEAIRDNKRVSVVGGRKIGKDFALAVAALWWFCCFPKARVFATATTGKQIEGILYREIRSLFAFSGRCLACKTEDPDGREQCEHSAAITGSVGLRASTGIKSDDFREILGFTADKAEGMAGWSGERVLAILDEASGIHDDIHVAIRGNLASENSREVLISNGTKSHGFFFDSHHTKKDLYHCIEVSSEETPNVLEDREVFPGLASRAWIEEQKAEWGEDSPLYKIHVKGQFVLNEEGSVFAVHLLHESTQRWEETDAIGQLTIGIDPAGDSGDGDESAFSVRRGMKILSLTARRGMTPEAHLVEALGFVATFREKNEHTRPRFVIDRDGHVGAKVWGVFVGYLQTHEGEFDLVGFRGGEEPQRAKQSYVRRRDELFGSLLEWLRSGGAITEDLKLLAELQVIKWIGHVSGKSKVIAKDDIKKVIGRSPDRADAVALSCWAASAADAEKVQATPQKQFSAEPEYTPAPSMDPYAAMRTWGGR